jgi:hypothetical protein
MQHSRKRLTQTVIPILCRDAWEAWTWPVPQYFSLAPRSAHATLRRLTRDDAMCTHDLMYNNIIHSMGRRFIDISDCFERFPTLFSRTTFFDIRLVLGLSEASCLLFISLNAEHTAAAPGLFLFRLHLWEAACRAFKGKTGYSLTAYVAGTLGFCLMSYWTASISSLSMACLLMI